MKNRLFIALNLPLHTIDQIVEMRKSVSKDDTLNWEPKNKLHLTIKFIGDVSSQTMEEISKELEFIEHYYSINCKFTKFGFFYRDNNPSVLWGGLETDASLNKLIDELNQLLNKRSILIEKSKFIAHITLLRIKNELGINFVNNFKNFTFKPILFAANTITLYKSILQSEGSKYSEIKNYKLK